MNLAHKLMYTYELHKIYHQYFIAKSKCCTPARNYRALRRSEGSNLGGKESEVNYALEQQLGLAPA
jgi:hypothetical protein